MYGNDAERVASECAQEAMAFAGAARSHAKQAAYDSVLALLAHDDGDVERSSTMLGNVIYHAGQANVAAKDAERAHAEARHAYASTVDADACEYVMIAHDEADDALYSARAANRAKYELMRQVRLTP